jgi:hypothetical protein
MMSRTDRPLTGSFVAPPASLRNALGMKTVGIVRRSKVVSQRKIANLQFAMINLKSLFHLRPARSPSARR